MNTNMDLLILSVFTVFYLEVNSHCPGRIGNLSETNFSAAGPNRFYLNTAAPAPCSGTITSWRYCYYKQNNIMDAQTFFASLAVYRQINLTTYNKVSDMFNIFLNRTQLDAQSHDFVCSTVDIAGFDIEAGYVVGACVFNPSGNAVHRLNIVGKANGYSLMQTSGSSTISSYCNLSSIPSTISNSHLSNKSSRILHLYANITNLPISPPTTATSTTEQTTSIAWTTTSNSGDVDSTNAALGDNNSAGSGGVIAGVVVLVLALSVAGIVTAIIVLITLKKRSIKSARCLQSYSRQEQTRENGINNCTYDINPGCVNAGCSMYDEIRNPGPQAEKTGDEDDNYYEVAESSFTGTYDCGATEIYSDLTEQCTHTCTAESEGQNRTERNIYETEKFYSSPDEPQTSLYYLLERNKQEDIYGDLNAYYAPASEENEIYSQLQTCGVTNISHTQIQITGHLGSGQFGIVEKGTWQGKEVALKTLKEGSEEEDKVKFLQEAAIMAQFRHPNIVTLHGVVSDREPLMLVVELIHRGDLREYLHTIRPDPGELPVGGLPDMLLSFSQHVALGMQYLSSKGFVHRDLAARNILVSKDNICKVADFGMSRDLADETYYVSHGGMIPVKWTAPEAIHYKKYSTASDVWSYGCLLYEIWSLGHKPFEELKNIEVIKLVDSNKRLSPPPGSPKLIYELMIKCWHPRTSSRPGFRELTIDLTGNQSDVLSIPQDDLCTHKLAGVLGAPIEAAKDMYLDLKNKYTFESETNFYD